MNDAAHVPRKGNGRTLLLACGALAREVIEFVERNGWTCFTVECLPAKLHWQPALIAPAVQEKIRASRHRFDRFVWEGLGIDRHPQLRELYFGNYEQAVYLAQTDDPELRARAEECARRLGLAYEHRFVGYGDFGRHIAIVAADAPAGTTPARSHATGAGGRGDA